MGSPGEGERGTSPDQLKGPRPEWAWSPVLQITLYATA